MEFTGTLALVCNLGIVRRVSQQHFHTLRCK